MNMTIDQYQTLSTFYDKYICYVKLTEVCYLPVYIGI